MRTKAKRLFTVVFFLAMSVAASRADSYNVDLIGGNYVFLANELNNSAGNYVSNVLQNLSPADSVLKFDPVSQVFYTAQKSDTLNPGEGAAVMHIAGMSTLTITRSATVAQAPLALTPGRFFLVSRRAGGLGPSTYDDLVGSPPVEGSTLLLWSVPVQDYLLYSYRNNQWNGPGGSSSTPQIPVGLSAFVVVQPAISITNTPGGQVILTWTALKAWTLEEADNAGGPWLTVTNAISP